MMTDAQLLVVAQDYVEIAMDDVSSAALEGDPRLSLQQADSIKELRALLAERPQLRAAIALEIETAYVVGGRMMRDGVVVARADGSFVVVEAS